MSEQLEDGGAMQNPFFPPLGRVVAEQTSILGTECGLLSPMLDAESRSGPSNNCIQVEFLRALQITRTWCSVVAGRSALITLVLNGI